ncbi:cupin domain-containing protein [Roseisolibacter sp. H3M3-2]|uniref:cupin domain-containing protein n=1 Tax=Roseisolibacter sp. H3M3-2 TaxID=3031323 RepID=UPI0023DAA4BA|nr:cupin domain-containing protein [Roseisolibacter sp. H3M3-2]MDF1504979.1 cupin domain-containing protein [Roseisolibacter sp. H3M3-2]
MSRSYPYTIENGAGERLTFLRRVPTPNGDRLEAENWVAPGSGPPMHTHYLQDEGFTVVEGRMAYQRAGGPVEYAGPGESAVFRRGEAHRFWNAGDTPLRCTGWLEPAHNFEYFLGHVFASMQRGGAARPPAFDAAFLTRRYRSEFAMHVVPAAVQRFVFPLVVALGTLLGRYARYADAPAPVRQ